MAGKKIKDAQIIEFQQRLAVILEEYRNTAGLSVGELAKITGISRSGIEKMESGKIGPTINSLKKYVEACGKSIGELFEEWIPKDRVKYERSIHCRIKEALRHPHSAKYIENMLESLRLFRLPSA